MTAPIAHGVNSSLARRSEWVRTGSALFANTLAHIGNDALVEPSLLPGWSRAHVAGHLARNADAQCNLLRWARTGVETPMYADPGARVEAITAAARQSPEALRADVHTSTARLAAELEAMPDAAWSATVRTARGRVVAATEVPWMRVREVWVHAVDLRAGLTFADIPADLARELAADALSGRLPCDEGVRLRVVATDVDLDVPVGTSNAATVEIIAPIGELLPWVLGRPDPASAVFGRPTPRPWL